MPGSTDLGKGLLMVLARECPVLTSLEGQDTIEKDIQTISEELRVVNELEVRFTADRRFSQQVHPPLCM